MRQKNVARHLIFIGIGILACLGLVGLFVIKVDPYGMFRPSHKYGKPLADLSVELEMSSYSYLSKAMQIIREKPDRVLLGTSIVDHGFRLPGATTLIYDPYPEKEARLRQKMATPFEWYNAGVCGGDPVSIYKYLVHAYANNPNLKEVFISFHLQSLQKRGSRGYVTVDDALLGRTSTPYLAVSQYVFTSMAIRDALRLYTTKHPALDGIVTSIENDSPSNLLSRLLTTPADNNGNQFTTVEPFPMDNVTLEGFSDPLLMRKLTFTIWGQASQQIYYDANPNEDPLDEVSFEYLRKIADFIKEKHLKAYVLISPHHPFLWAASRQFGLESSYEKAERELAKTLPYWDLSETIDFSPEVDHYFDTDSYHFNEAAGEVILPLITTGTLAQKGRYVTPDNVEDVIKWRRKLLDDWEAQHPQYTSIISALNYKTFTFGNTPTTNLAFMRNAYKGYAIVDFYGTYYAFPESEKKPYEWQKIMNKGYSPAFTADNLQALLPQLDAKPLKTAEATPVSVTSAR